jgi:3-oxoacyl-(acyl-carrier-protein) synthase
VTVTAKASDIEGLIYKAREHDMRTSPVHVQGRFHATDYRRVAEKLIKFESLFKDSQFGDASTLLVPVRDTAAGERLEKGSLSRFALQNTLLNVADWYKTLSRSLKDIKGLNQTIAIAGNGYFIPKALFRDSGARLMNLGSAELSGTNLGTSSLSHHENINGIANGIADIHDVESHEDLSQYPSHSIAIVGMAGRFPGADSVDELWKLITEERTTVEPAPVARLHLPQTGDHENTKWWGNFLNNPDAFDHKFFRKSSREAVAWDPQQRILLEVIYEALESAGYFGPSAGSEPLDYGCYIGAVMNNYYDNLSCHAGTAYATVGTSRCYLSGCMSHYFGWTGPSLTIDTACSSSLVAINTACRAIWSGECSRAIAGGTNVICSPFDYQNLSAAGFLSPSGQCKPFDADADGYCRGEAVAVVVLKPLKDAIDAEDNILGVVVGSAANQNHNFSHITAPYSGSQVELYQKVMELGNVHPESVTYVEAHGTGSK